MFHLTLLSVFASCSSETSFSSEPDPPDVVATPEPNDEQPVVDCEDADTEQVELHFNARQGCPFSRDGNLDPRNEHIQARVDEARLVVPPEGASLCEVTLESRDVPVSFDDHLAILVDDVVLVSGGSGVALDDHPFVDDLPRYDWFEVQGRRFSDRYSDYECLGEGRCLVPRTEEVGPLDLSVDADTMSAIAASLDLAEGFEVRILTFGDDDWGDCAHSDLRLNLTIRYVPGGVVAR